MVDIRDMSGDGIRSWTRSVIKDLCEGLYERDEIMAISLLTVLSGQSVFLYGPPGTAKSLISRRISCAFSDSRYFEYLMQRFSTPEEVFGPVSISELKHDNYIRKTENYLPTADIAFLDEIWKSSPAILNTLLTIINERKFKNGSMLEDAPLKALIAASNEFPVENSGLDALYDRFIVRMCVNPTKDKGNFRKVISDNRVASRVPVSHPLTTVEWEYIMESANNVILTDTVFQQIERIRDKIDEYNSSDNSVPVYVSDRRWQKAIFVVKTAAFLSGRSSVVPMDLYVLKHCLWSNLENKGAIDSIVDSSLECSAPFIPSGMDDWESGYKVIMDSLDEVFRTYGKKETYHIGRRECYKVTVSKHTFTGNRTTEYYIPVDQLTAGMSYPALGFDGALSIQYKVESNDLSHAMITIDNTPKSISLSAGEGLADKSKLKPIHKALELKIEEISRLMRTAEEELSAVESEFSSPFVPTSDGSRTADSLRDTIDKMRRCLNTANGQLEKVIRNEQ